jgi:hypothetical protein
MRSGGAGGGDPPPLTQYATTWSEAGGPARPGLDLALGFAWDADHAIPQPVVRLAGQDVSDNVILSVDAAQSLLLAVDLTAAADVVCALTPAPYLLAHVAFTPDGARFSGSIARTCAGAASYAWQGACRAAGAAWLVSMWRWTLAREALRLEAAG